MIIQNAGLVTVISTFVLSFVNADTNVVALQRGAVLVSGVVLLIFLAKNSWVEHQLERLIEWALQRYTDLRVIDYHTMLNLQEGYTVSRFKVDEDSWLSDKSLEDLNLQAEGVMILCIECDDGSITCAPAGNDRLSVGDELTVYGREGGLQELKSRPNDESGQESHEEAKEEYQKEENKRD